MFKRFINQCVSNFFLQDIPTRNNSFLIQKKFLKTLISQYQSSPLYQTLWIKQDKTIDDIISFDSYSLKNYFSQYSFCDYQKHILPCHHNKQWITSDAVDLFIRTSGTSDANSGGKLIPAEWKSFDNERIWIKRTLSYYLKENPVSNILFSTWFWLTAPFDIVSKIWYVSGAMRYAHKKYSYKMFPNNDILAISDWNIKKKTIIEELLHKKIHIGSFHGVPTWPLDIIQELIDKDNIVAKRVLTDFEYVSIGWWPAWSYKESFQEKVQSLWLSQKIYWSNNHNASEWFLWAQVRNFGDLSYHWMSPVMQTNFFLFVPISLFDDYKNNSINYTTMITSSHLLHEVEYGIEYLILFANHRIPWLYNIKDKVMFQKNDNLSDENTILEYNVTWRYGMASNIFNEHIEIEHLYYVIERLIENWYGFSKNSFVAGMQLLDNQWIFHIIVESETLSYDSAKILQLIDQYMGEINDQWKIFRWRNKIQSLSLVFVSSGMIRKWLIELGKMHEQSKLPHLSDKNFDCIIEPLLSYIKKE